MKFIHKTSTKYMIIDSGEIGYYNSHRDPEWVSVWKPGEDTQQLLRLFDVIFRAGESKRTGDIAALLGIKP